MKHLAYKKSKLLSFSLLFICSNLFSESVSTDTIGYVTIDVKGGGKTNIINSPGLLQPISSRGTGNVTNGITLDVTGNPSYLDDEYANTHYVQFTSSGDWAAISSNTPGSIRLETAVEDGADLDFVIRPLNTLDSLFGSDNSAGFKGGSNFGTSDRIFIWDADEQAFGNGNAYYYNSDNGEWQDVLNDSAGSAIIYPDESLIIVAVNNFDLTFTGSVQEDSMSATVTGGGNTSIIANPYSVDLQISECGLESSLSGGSSFGVADKVFIWDPSSQTFTKAYYYNNSSGESPDGEWQNVLNQTVNDNDVIPIGSAAVVVRSSDDDVTLTFVQPF